MNKRETWILLILMVFVVGIVYMLENKPADSTATNGNLTPTIAPIWTISPDTVQSVRFEDLKTGKFIDLENSVGKWSVVRYNLVTPSAIPTEIGTDSPTPLPSATLGSGITPSATPTLTSTASPTASLVASLTPSLTPVPPTMEAESDEWVFVVKNLAALLPAKRLEGDLKPQDFGLDSPNYRLTLKMTDGKVAILNIGSSVTVKSAGYYAQVAGTTSILLIPSDFMGVLIGYLTNPPILKTITSVSTATMEPTITFTLTPTPTFTPTLTAESTASATAP
jgi:hypothetical protein